MKSKIANKILMLCIIVLIPWILHAKQIVIKLATLAPEGSQWHEIIVEMGQKWNQATDGLVTLRIYPSGVAGDERDMIRKIRIGQLHAAAVTIEGLTDISRNMNVFFIPMLVETFEELDQIRSDLMPELSAELEENGFKILTWADVGWAYWFTKKPIKLPEELKEMRLFTWAGDYRTTELWKKAGFRPIPLSSIDILPSLQTGLIDAFSTTPIVALSFQWFGLAPNMLDLKWGPVIGAMIISNEMWHTIPVEYHQVLLDIAAEAGDQARRILLQVDNALDVMGEHGLTIHSISPEEKQKWIDLTRSFYPYIRGSLVPEEIFDKAIQLKEKIDAQRDK